MPDFSSADETSYFRRCRRLDGGIEEVDVARRNRRRVPRFHPSITEAPEAQAEESAEYRELVDEVCENLNETERRTWLRIIDGRSILDVAEEEGVSRPAVYDRLRRMVKKNRYVAIWWRLKNKTNQYQ